MNQELIDRVTESLPGTVMRAVEKNGTVAVVEDRGFHYFTAIEFTQEQGGDWIESGGYSTGDKGYMGERYRDHDLWGEFIAEVFIGIDTVHKPLNPTEQLSLRCVVSDGYMEMAGMEIFVTDIANPDEARLPTLSEFESNQEWIIHTFKLLLRERMAS